MLSPFRCDILSSFSREYRHDSEKIFILQAFGRVSTSAGGGDEEREMDWKAATLKMIVEYAP